MKILIVSTLKRNVAPHIFASRSRIIYQLSEGLAKRGHQVSLLGTKDSYVPGVNMIPVLDKCWVDLPAVENQFLRETASLLMLVRKIEEIQGSFDIIHNHTYPDFSPMVIEDNLRIPMATTLHALHDTYMEDVLSTYNKTYLVSLSKAYTRLYKKVKFQFVVYNGVNTDLYKYSDQKEDYLFWLGRLPKGKNKEGKFIDPKGVGWAIKLAQATGQRLFLSAPVEDKAFYEQEIKPYLNDKIVWVGGDAAVNSEQKVPFEEIIKLFRGAKAFLMTINQEEPFGLVMAEAGSCGTPIIGFNRGSVPEVIVDGKTGFVVDPQKGVEGLKEALEKIDTIKPIDCRNHIQKNFSIDKMVSNYESVYRQMIEGKK